MSGERRFNRYIAPSLAGSVLALGAAACGGNSLMTSPATVSPAYPGNPHESGSNPINWHEVILINPRLPEPVTNADMIVGFEVPGSNNWHESKPMPLDPTFGEILLRIGPGPVEFRVQIQATKGSVLTKEAPRVEFEGPETYSKAIKSPDVIVPPGWQQ